MLTPVAPTSDCRPWESSSSELVTLPILQIVAAFAYERFGDNVMMVKEVMTEPLAKARLEEMIEEV